MAKAASPASGEFNAVHNSDIENKIIFMYWRRILCAYIIMHRLLMIRHENLHSLKFAEQTCSVHLVCLKAWAIGYKATCSFSA